MGSRAVAVTRDSRLQFGPWLALGPVSCRELTTLARYPSKTGGSSVDFHLTRSLRLHTKPEHKNLYAWAINEIDAKGQQIGRDQIPWPWTLNFTATSCVLIDSIEIKTKTAPAREITQDQVIRVTLRPGIPRDDADFFRKTTFSMFGTDRSIESFQLEIHPIADPAKQESCSAWGSVSYTRKSTSGTTRPMTA